MNHQPKNTEHPIDGLVRGYLQRQSEREDGAKMARRVMASLAPSLPATSGRNVRRPSRVIRRSTRKPTDSGWRRWARPAAWVSAAAAACVVAFVLGRSEVSVQASPANLVRAAMSVHADPLERCYVVNVAGGGWTTEEVPPLPRDVRIWTQGDRFWVQMDQADRTWTWGRNERGAVWMILGRHRALVVEPEEQGQAIRYLSDLYSLELEALLADVVRHFEVQHDSSSPTTHTITARPRHGGRPWIRQLTIDVDRETKAIRRLVLVRNLPLRGESTVTFTLVDTRVPDETRYQPEGHLSEPYRVFSKTVNPDKRRDVIRSWFRASAERWIRQIPAASSNTNPDA